MPDKIYIQNIKFNVKIKMNQVDFDLLKLNFGQQQESHVNSFAHRMGNAVITQS